MEADIPQLAHQHGLVDFHEGGAHPAPAHGVHVRLEVHFVFQDDAHDLPVRPLRHVNVGLHFQERLHVFCRKRFLLRIERPPGQPVRRQDQGHGHRLLFGCPSRVQDVFHFLFKQFPDRIFSQQTDVLRPGQPVIIIDEIHHAVAVLQHVVRAFDLNDAVLHAAAGQVLRTGFLPGEHEGVLPCHLLLQGRIGHAAPVDAFRYLHDQVVVIIIPAFDGLQFIAEKGQVPQHGVPAQLRGEVDPGLQIAPAADGSDQVFVLGLAVQPDPICIGQEAFPRPAHMAAGLHHRNRIHI